MKIIKLIALTCATTLVLFAAQLLLSDVLKMYQNNTLKDSLTAFELLEKEANNGSNDAAFLLATAYQNGKIGTVDSQS
jgi:TPR repeat protein